MADRSRDIIVELQELGITKHDALVIADCIITRKSCTWMNSDPVDETVIAGLKELVAKKDYRISVKIDGIPTRNKCIWDIKVF